MTRVQAKALWSVFIFACGTAFGIEFFTTPACAGETEYFRTKQPTVQEVPVAVAPSISTDMAPCVDRYPMVGIPYKRDPECVPREDRERAAYLRQAAEKWAEEQAADYQAHYRDNIREKAHANKMHQFGFYKNDEGVWVEKGLARSIVDTYLGESVRTEDVVSIGAVALVILIVLGFMLKSMSGPRYIGEKPGRSTQQRKHM